MLDMYSRHRLALASNIGTWASGLCKTVAGIHIKHIETISNGKSDSLPETGDTQSGSPTSTSPSFLVLMQPISLTCSCEGCTVSRLLQRVLQRSRLRTRLRLGQIWVEPLSTATGSSEPTSISKP